MIASLHQTDTSDFTDWAHFIIHNVYPPGAPSHITLENLEDNGGGWATELA